MRARSIWVADGAGNISTLREHSLVFVNRMDGSQQGCSKVGHDVAWHRMDARFRGHDGVSI